LQYIVGQISTGMPEHRRRMHISFTVRDLYHRGVLTGIRDILWFESYLGQIKSVVSVLHLISLPGLPGRLLADRRHFYESWHNYYYFALQSRGHDVGETAPSRTSLTILPLYILLQRRTAFLLAIIFIIIIIIVIIAWTILLHHTTTSYARVRFRRSDASGAAAAHRPGTTGFTYSVMQSL